jgi:ABC-type branched-subunit amino acid transport system permease subunit
MTLVLGQVPGTVLSLCVIAGVGSQLSVAVALPVATGSVEVLHWTVAGGGQVITGAVVSTTLMVCTQELLLPAQSVAVQVRVITEVLGQVPGTELSLWVIAGAGSQLSVAVALPVAAGSLEVLHWTVAGGGQMITGAVVSTTLMVWTQELLLPAQSVAVQVRVMTEVLGQVPATVLSL